MRLNCLGTTCRRAATLGDCYEDEPLPFNYSAAPSYGDRGNTAAKKWVQEGQEWQRSAYL